MAKRDDSNPFCFCFGTSDPHCGYTLNSGRESGIDVDAVHVPEFYPDEEVIRSDIGDYYFEVQRWDSDNVNNLANDPQYAQTIKTLSEQLVDFREVSQIEGRLEALVEAIGRAEHIGELEGRLAELKVISNPIGRALIRLSAGAEKHAFLKDHVVDIARYANEAYRRNASDYYLRKAPVLLLFHGNRTHIAK